MALILNLSQQLAVYKVAEMMVKADNQVLSEEVNCIKDGMSRISSSSLDELQRQAENLSKMDALKEISLFNEEAKMFVAALLGTILSVDGDIADEELALWRFVTDICVLPKMNVRQANNIYLQK